MRNDRTAGRQNSIESLHVIRFQMQVSRFHELPISLFLFFVLLFFYSFILPLIDFPLGKPTLIKCQSDI